MAPTITHTSTPPRIQQPTNGSKASKAAHISQHTLDEHGDCLRHGIKINYYRMYYPAPIFEYNVEGRPGVYLHIAR